MRLQYKMITPWNYEIYRIRKFLRFEFSKKIGTAGITLEGGIIFAPTKMGYKKYMEEVFFILKDRISNP